MQPTESLRNALSHHKSHPSFPTIISYVKTISLPNMHVEINRTLAYKSVHESFHGENGFSEDQRTELHVGTADPEGWNDVKQNYRLKSQCVLSSNILQTRLNVSIQKH